MDDHLVDELVTTLKHMGVTTRPHAEHMLASFSRRHELTPDERERVLANFPTGAPER